MRSVSRETGEALARLAGLIDRWNPTINLVGPNTIAQLWPRHIEESLRVAGHVRPEHTVVDLGSGAGFPGLVVALAVGCSTTLVEADARKAAFLREAVRQTRASAATVLEARAEEITGIRFDVVTARAFAPLTRLLPLTARLLQESGFALFLKGRQAETELNDVRSAWAFDVVRESDARTPGSVLLRVSNLRSTKLNHRAAR